MSSPGPSSVPGGQRAAAQEVADRVRVLRRELASEELQSVLALTPDQRDRFEAWARTKLEVLAQQYDVDTTASQKRMSWAMRIASTLGGLALCAAVVLFFVRYWGFLNTPVQVAIVIAIPLMLLGAAEIVAGRERTRYFTGLLALVTLASFMLNLSVVGSVFNIASTEGALLPWGALAIVLAYRYGLRLMLGIGLVILMSYFAATLTSQMGYHWLTFYNRPEDFLFFGASVFAVQYLKHRLNSDFPPVYRLVGAVTFFLAILSLAEWGVSSYLPWPSENIERFYEFAGLLLSAGAIWFGILRNWNGLVNAGAPFFVVFLFARLYHWWWHWMPRYLFFGVIGALGILLVLAFKRLRAKVIHAEDEVLA